MGLLVETISSWWNGSSIDDIRRFLTPLFIVLDLILVGVFTYAAAAHWKKAPYRENLVVQASLSLGTYFFGQLITRIWGWFVLFVSRSDGSVVLTLQWDWVLVMAFVGSFISIIGAAWAAYVFTPSEWRAKGWIFAAIALALFIFLTRTF